MLVKDKVIRYFAEDGCNPITLLGPHPWHEPVDIFDILEDLGLKLDDIVYFPGDVYNYAKGGKFDPANVPRMDVSQPFRRIKSAPRSAGFKAAAAMARDLIDEVKSANRNSKWTLYGRIWGEKFDFEIEDKKKVAI